jgi:hypothetical protein
LGEAAETGVDQSADAGVRPCWSGLLALVDPHSRSVVVPQMPDRSVVAPVQIADLQLSDFADLHAAHCSDDAVHHVACLCVGESGEPIVIIA